MKYSVRRIHDTRYAVMQQNGAEHIDIAITINPETAHRIAAALSADTAPTIDRYSWKNWFAEAGDKS